MKGSFLPDKSADANLPTPAALFRCVLSMSWICAHVLRLKFSRICMLPGKIMPPFTRGVLSYYDPFGMSRVFLLIFYKQLACLSKTLEVIQFLGIITIVICSCALSTREDYTETALPVKGKICFSNLKKSPGVNYWKPGIQNPVPEARSWFCCRSGPARSA